MHACSEPGWARASRSGKFAATAGVLGGLFGSQGGKAEGGTAAWRRRPAPGGPGTQGGSGRGGRGFGSRSVAELPRCPPSNSVLSSRRLRSGALPPAPEPGVGGCSMPARAP